MSERRRRPLFEVFLGDDPDDDCAEMRRLNRLYDEVVEAVPPSSDVGLFHRAVGQGPLTGRPDAAVDALQAAEQLVQQAEEARDRALIALRHGAMTWAEVGQRLGMTRTQAKDRFGRRSIRVLERAGLLDNVDRALLPAAVAPVIGTPRLDDARAWCRWCGQRIIADDGWRHTAGPDSTELAHPRTGLPYPDGEPHEAWPAEDD